MAKQPLNPALPFAKCTGTLKDGRVCGTIYRPKLATQTQCRGCMGNADGLPRAIKAYDSEMILRRLMGDGESRGKYPSLKQERKVKIR